MGQASKNQYLHFLNDTNILLNMVRAKYGDDVLSVKLIEDLQEEVIEAMQTKLRRASDEQTKEYFFRARDRVNDIIRDHKL